jgi:MoaA/NifB/PqqE/SkfB family radical SAM enzyme
VSFSTLVSRKARSAREFVRGLTHTAHPLLVQIIPIRRCNIDCGYCNEYDKVSAPIDTAVMKARIDKLKALGTSVVAFSGGEPMLHPDLDDLIRHIRRRGMLAGLITNGYFLVPKRIEALNAAGLDFLQISVDNVEPDEVSKKSLRVLDRKLQNLKEHADEALYTAKRAGRDRVSVWDQTLPLTLTPIHTLVVPAKSRL